MSPTGDRRVYSTCVPGNGKRLKLYTVNVASANEKCLPGGEFPSSLKGFLILNLC